MRSVRSTGPRAMLIAAQYTGATPVEECLRWLDEHPDVERRSVLPYRDRLLAMLGRFDEAHRLLAEAADRVAELGVVRFEICLATASLRRRDAGGRRCRRGGGGAGGVRDGRTASAELGNFMLFCGNLAQALLGLGRDDEAEQWLERGRETRSERGAVRRSCGARLRGKVLARRGELEEGERLAREAVAIAGGDGHAECACGRASRSRGGARRSPARTGAQSSSRRSPSTSGRATSSWRSALARSSPISPRLPDPRGADGATHRVPRLPARNPRARPRGSSRTDRLRRRSPQRP